MLLAVALLWLSACTSEADPTVATDPTVDASVSTITTEAPEPVENEPAPIVLDRRASLRVLPGECYSELTIDQPRQDPLMPESLWVDVVDCSGTHQAEVYAVGCLGFVAELEELVAMACPGSEVDAWPGKVELQRAAVKACLPLFEAVHGESYAETELQSVELMPEETTWLVGERTVVCATRR